VTVDESRTHSYFCTRCISSVATTIFLIPHPIPFRDSLGLSQDPTTREFVPRAVGDIVQQDLRDERETFIQTLASKFSACESHNHRLKNERFELVEEINSLKLQLTSSNASLANLQRDSLTITSLKDQVKASAEDAANARHDMTKQMDEVRGDKERSDELTTPYLATKTTQAHTSAQPPHPTPLRNHRNNSHPYSQPLSRFASLIAVLDGTRADDGED